MHRQFTNLRSPNDTRKVVEQILTIGPIAQTTTYIGSVKLVPGHWTIAHNVGQARKAIKDLKGRQAGEARDSDVETEAVLAEFITAQLLDSTDCRIAPLVSHKPDPALDVTIGGVSFDIKCIRSCAKCTAINADSHAKKAPAFYLFALVVNGHCIDFFVVSSRAVNAWPVRTKYRGNDMPPRKHYRAADLPASLCSPECCIPA